MTTTPPPILEHLARRLLEEEGGDLARPALAGEAAERLFATFHGHLTPLLGSSGFGSVLKRSLLRSVRDHPVLETARVLADPAVPLAGLTHDLEDQDPDEVARGLVSLVSRFLAELGEVERGRDPSVFTLWPALAESFDPEDLVLRDGEWE